MFAVGGVWKGWRGKGCWELLEEKGLRMELKMVEEL
jgi:hypothetical protein